MHFVALLVWVSGHLKKKSPLPNLTDWLQCPPAPGGQQHWDWGGVGKVCQVWGACRPTGSSRHMGVQSPSSKTAGWLGMCLVAALGRWKGTMVPSLGDEQGSSSEGACGMGPGCLWQWESIVSQDGGVFGSDKGFRPSGFSCSSFPMWGTHPEGDFLGTERCQSQACGDAHKMLPSLFYMAILGFCVPLRCFSLLAALQSSPRGAIIRG